MKDPTTFIFVRRLSSRHRGVAVIWPAPQLMGASSIDIPVSVKRYLPLARASALQNSSRNSITAPDLVFLMLIVPRVFFSGGVFFSQTPVRRAKRALGKP